MTSMSDAPSSGRIRMNGHGRKTGRMRKLAAQVAPPTVDRRGRDIGSARDGGNRRARRNCSLHQGKLALVAPMATPLNAGQYSDLGHRHVSSHGACTVANISAQTVTRQMPPTGCRQLMWREQLYDRAFTRARRWKAAVPLSCQKTEARSYVSEAATVSSLGRTCRRCLGRYRVGERYGRALYHRRSAYAPRRDLYAACRLCRRPAP